jgi:hypothetical protein
LRTHPRISLLRSPWACRYCWDQLWSLQEILTDNLNMRHIAAKFVPRLLTNDQEQWRINVSLELWENANEDPTFTSISGIIMGDRSCIYNCDPETKQQSSQWKRSQSPRAKKVWQVWSSIKSMLIVFFFQRGGDCSSWICSS